ncbi:MAG: hypothetical protein J6O55_05670 [Lachnospiraceae bacterium]|nr:hypothetical protein [Lachnospiraceae bacterium]
MADVMNFKCPSCGAPLTFQAGTQEMTCEYCTASFTLDDVRAAEAAEARSAEASDMTWVDSQPEMITDENGKMTGFSCPSCGAEIVADEGTGATECPYCGNQAIVPQAFEGVYKPDCMIPFKIDRKGAENALQDFYKGKALLPDDFSKGNRVKKIQGVYVPFWLMSCHAEGKMTFDAEKVKRWNDRKYDYVKRDHYLLNREGGMDFTRIPSDGSKQMDDATMDSLEPFDYKDFVPYEKAYFSGYLANRYDVEAEEVLPHVRERIEKSVSESLYGTTSGFESVETKSQSITTSDSKTEYAMLPVWMLSTKYEDKVYTFAMNGQTGKMVGELPIDKGKCVKYFAISSIIALVVILALMALLTQGITGMMFVISLLVSLLIGYIVLSVLKGGMKNIALQTAAGHYVSEGSFNLSVSHDSFLYSKTEKREREQNNS